jgi:hypothetical protein
MLNNKKKNKGPMMWVLSMKEEKYKEIPSQNIVMHKGGLVQKEA